MTPGNNTDRLIGIIGSVETVEFSCKFSTGTSSVQMASIRYDHT
jgi:hypothetical protein